MESFSKQKWEDLNLSRDEVKSIGDALQKEEFRNLLLEYVKEINDPENLKQYEREITQLEKERGVDIKFVHPSSGYVIKTSVDGVSKAFINICSNTNVGKPCSTPDIDGGHHGLRWSIPYCLAPPRDDFDKKNNACSVFDVVFHPDTLHMTKSNDAFKKLVNNTALEAVEENFHVSLDKINVKFPKMQFKGMKRPTVIRNKINNFHPDDVIDIPNYPYPPFKEEAQPVPKTLERTNVDLNIKCSKDIKYTTPHYKIKYRNNVDIQNFTNDPLSKMSITVPNELVIGIQLPLLKHASDISLEVSENSLALISENPAKYKLNLVLPYIVDSVKGNAKFELNEKALFVTLPVIRKSICTPETDAGREDSGVESDNYVRGNGITSDEDENETSCINKAESGRISDNKTELTYLDDGAFLKSEVQYLLPNFTCQYLKNVLTFTLQVPNVNPESVDHRFLNGSSGVHFSFQSVGTGFYPINYAMCILLTAQNQIEKESFNVEVWDNNVIALLKPVQCDVHLTECYVGIDENSLEEFNLPAPLEYNHLGKSIKSTEKCITDNRHDESTEESNFDSTKNVGDTTELGDSKNVKINQQLENACAKLISFQSSFQTSGENRDSTEENNTQNEDTDEFLEEGKDLSESGSSFDESTSSPHHQSVKPRTLSESHQELMRSKNRGILKIGRSLSESNVDDYASWSPEKLEKTKKTVRFSEVISKQTFRMNSSILGQRKKNQRKMRNKKRAQERRLSESGNDSEGENEVPFVKGISFGKIKEIDVWLKEPESSSCDVSEVSEVSDISESDDGQQPEREPFIPCSSKRNHKRRGKKSARKNAATAKLQFMEN